MFRDIDVIILTYVYTFRNIEIEVIYLRKRKHLMRIPYLVFV